MFDNISHRDKKALILGGIAAGAIVLFFGISPWLNNWRATHTYLTARRDKIHEIISTTESLNTVVPTFKTPSAENIQGPLFRDIFSNQLEKAGVMVKSLQFITMGSQRKVAGYKVLRLQCRGRCSFSQVINLLADLNSNPYFVGIEDIDIKFTDQTRKELDLQLTVSTFAR